MPVRIDTMIQDDGFSPAASQCHDGQEMPRWAHESAAPATSMKASFYYRLTECLASPYTRQAYISATVSASRHIHHTGGTGR